MCVAVFAGSVGRGDATGVTGRLRSWGNKIAVTWRLMQREGKEKVNGRN